VLNVLRATLRMGRVTMPYPGVDEAASPAYRGRPALDAGRCTCAGACVEVCPSQVISLHPSGPDTSEWRLDLAGCVFCGLCEDACPEGAIHLTNEFALAARTRANLVEACTVSGRPTGTRQSVEVSRAQPTHPAAAPNRRIRNLLGRSLHIRHMDTGSDNACDWEIAALLGPVYDVQRLGIDFVASPRHADMLLVTGAVTRHLQPALMATYVAMPSPKLVVAVGDEACGGGVLQGSYAVAGGVDRVLPVDVYIPGSPPRPQALIHGILLALGRAQPYQSFTAQQG